MKFEKMGKLLSRMRGGELVFSTGAYTDEGHLIWESDIIENRNGARFEIKWNPFVCGFSAVREGHYLDIFELEKKSGPVKVVGNSYENPDLLK